MACVRRAKRIERGRLAFQLLAALPAVFALAMSHASAQAPGGGFSRLGGANSKKPIDIESDRLEVDDKKHLAIFIGSVSATQGDFNLKAPRLEVTYENASQANPADKTAQAPKPAKPAKAPAAANAGGDPLSSGQIKLIHALGGSVVLTSQKDFQEATGEDAVYDVLAQKVTMTGKKVVLKQKKNIVEGRKLLIDLATGQATVIPDDDSAYGTAAVHKGRVRAVFQQEGANLGSMNPFASTPNKTDASPPQKSASPQAAPSAGWQAQGR